MKPARPLTRRAAALLMLAAPLGGCAAGGAADMALRRQLANEVAAVVFNRAQIDRVIAPFRDAAALAAQAMGLVLGVDAAPAFARAFDAMVDGRLNAVSARAGTALAENFTLADLQDLLRAYRSRSGQKLIAGAFDDAADRRDVVIDDDDLRAFLAFVDQGLAEKSGRVLLAVLDEAFRAEFNFDAQARRLLLHSVESELKG